VIRSKIGRAAASTSAAVVVALPVGVAASGSLDEADTLTTPTDPVETTPAQRVDWHAIALRRGRQLRRARAESVARWRMILRLRRTLRARVEWTTNGVVAGLLCIHRGEGSWSSNTGNGYQGGLQMDDSFQWSYGRTLVQRYGGAHEWPIAAQLAVGVVAFYSGRGFYPWPNTARACGLIG